MQHIAAMIGEMQPTVGSGGNGTNGTNLIRLSLEPNDAKRRPHTSDFRDEQLGHGTECGFWPRVFEDFARAAMRWRISTL